MADQSAKAETGRLSPHQVWREKAIWLLDALTDATRELRADGELEAVLAHLDQHPSLAGGAAQSPGDTQRRLDAEDAAKWRALLSCARVRPLGSAGLEKDDEHNPDYAHIGFELWTIYPMDYPGWAEQAEKARELGKKWLERFVEKVQRLAGSEPAKTRWCVNIQGPDDVHAMPSKAVALERANELNLYFGRLASESKTPEYDPVMRAVVIEWPHSAESHAASLAKEAPNA